MFGISVLKEAHQILEEARRHGQSLPLREINTALLGATPEPGAPERDSLAISRAIRMTR